jgi:hypothetical protein
VKVDKFHFGATLINSNIYGLTDINIFMQSSFSAETAANEFVLSPPLPFLCRGDYTAPTPFGTISRAVLRIISHADQNINNSGQITILAWLLTNNRGCCNILSQCGHEGRAGAGKDMAASAGTAFCPWHSPDRTS